MDIKIMIVALVALGIGVGGGYVLAGGEDVASEPMMHVMHDGSFMHDQMSGMMAGLEGKTGDDFDKAFLSEMIIHHEGAVEMAEAALVNAKHEEIKQMASEIISAQTREIQQMRDWKNSWYGQ